MPHLSDRQVTDTSAKALKAAAAGLRVNDYLLFVEQPGLRLVAGKRKRSWVHRYRNAEGETVQVTLGPFPAVSYAAAVARYEENLRRRAADDDPAAARDRELGRRKAAKAAKRQGVFTIEAMVRAYMTGYGALNWKPKTLTEAERLTERDIVPAIGHRPANAITTTEAREFILALAPSMGRVAGLLLAQAHEHQVGGKHLPADAPNPWLQARKQPAVKAHVKQGKRERFLTPAEIRTLFQWLPQSGLSRTVQDALELTLRLGMRSGEIMATRWDQIDLDDGLWSIPAPKNGKPRVLPIPPQALEVLRRRVGLHDRWLFPNPTGTRPVNQKALSWALNKAEDSCPLEPFTPHDLRRSARTGLARIGCPFEVAETILGHKLGGVAGIYNQHGFEREQREWLTRWNETLP